MENASKALIIAGAILLSILLITLGIIVYRQAAGVIDNNAMDEIAVSTFNSKFEQYEGDNVRGTQVNALLSAIVQNNLSNKGDISKQISLIVPGTYGDNTAEGKACWKGTFKWTTESKTPDRPNDPLYSLQDTGRAYEGKSYKVESHKDPKSGYIIYMWIYRK